MEPRREEMEPRREENLLEKCDAATIFRLRSSREQATKTTKNDENWVQNDEKKLQYEKSKSLT
jgi:hypothetical protein